MDIKENIYRSYDIRGIYPGEINEDTVYYTTKAFCAMFPHVKKVTVAHDPRLSSKPLSDAAIKSFLEEGIDVIYQGVAPDPLFYFGIFHYVLDGGLMISGSHNPKDHNGLTYHVRKKGKSASEDVTLEDMKKLKELTVEFAKKAKQPHFKKGKLSEEDYSDDYVNYISQKIALKKPLKIVVDPGNGACGYLPERLFKRLGCEVVTIFGDFDGNFPNHLPDPYVAENRKALEQKVIALSADVGFAYDADGDRVAVIDKRGRTVDGDAALLILARQAVEKKKGPVVHCMRASKAFIDDMSKRGVQTYFSVSHHNAVREKIMETNAVFGGEITFHYGFPLDYYLVDDAVFASVELARVASEHDDFSAYVDSLPRYYPSPELFIDSPDALKFGIIENLKDLLRKRRYDFIEVDGARINFEHGWALARVSNTTPIIKCRFEGDTPEVLKEIEMESLAVFKDAGIPIGEKDREALGL